MTNIFTRNTRKAPQKTTPERCLEGALRELDVHEPELTHLGFQVQIKLVQTKHTGHKFSAFHHQLHYPTSFSLAAAISPNHRMGTAPEDLEPLDSEYNEVLFLYAQLHCHRLPNNFLPGSAHARLCKEAGRKRCPGVAFQHRPWHYAVCTWLKH